MNNLQLKTYRKITWNKFENQIYSVLLSRKLWMILLWLVFWLTHFTEAFPFFITKQWQKIFPKVFYELTAAGTVPDFHGIPNYAVVSEAKQRAP